MHLVTYATPRYEASRQRLLRSAKQWGDFKCWSFSSADFSKTARFRQHRDVTCTARGGGLWLWKPHYILEVLAQLRDGEHLVYLDAGIELIAPIDPLMPLCERSRGVALFRVHGRLNRHWTKRDCLVLMHCDVPPFLDTEQTMSGIIVLKKSEFVVNLMQEWLHYAADRRIVSDDPNTCGLPNYEGFVEHRHDQSILNNLRIKHGLAGYTDPTQWGSPYRHLAGRGIDDYPTLLNLHRERRPSWRTATRLLLRDPQRFARGLRHHVMLWVGKPGQKERATDKAGS